MTKKHAGVYRDHVNKTQNAQLRSTFAKKYGLPLTSIYHISNSDRCALWHITEDSATLSDSMLLPEGMAAMVSSFKHDLRKRQWLSARILISALLGSSSYALQYDENGKPVLIPGGQNISITHSGDYAAVMMSSGNHCGIDIEQVSNRIERVADRFLCEKESEFISAESRPLHQTLCWAAKEAVFKYHGKKDLDYRNCIQLGAFVPSVRGYITAQLITPEHSEDLLLRYECFNNYVMAYLT